MFVPAADALEAALVQGVDVYPITDLASLVEHLRGTKLIAKQASPTSFDLGGETVHPVAFEDVKG